MKTPTGPRILAPILILLCATTFCDSARAAPGRTVGNFAVSTTGAATYNIPIWSPPGPRGIQPAISLLYNSQSGIGPLGVGWSIEGLGNITRCPKTVAQDGTAAPVALVANDGYCINGNRLRITGGDYGAAGSTYQTEVADFSLIIANGQQGNGPASFTVQLANGLTYEYGYVDANGNGANSAVIAQGTSTVLTWYLSKVIDKAGNNYVINYKPGSGSLVGTAVPNTILWTPTSAGASSYAYTMLFIYGSNIPQSSINHYIAGTPVTNSLLLTSIEILYDGAVVKDYFLAYGTSPTTEREQLSTVTECADAQHQNCLYPTSISYGGPAAGVSTTANTALPSTGPNLTARYDLNGDGIADLVYQDSTTGAWYVAFGSPSGYQPPTAVGVSTSAGKYGFLIGNLTGNGQDAILGNNNGTWYYYYWNGTTFEGSSTGIPFDANTASYQLADVNGDGLPDLIDVQSICNPNTGLCTSTIYVRPNSTSGGVPNFGPAATWWGPSGVGAWLATPDQQTGKTRKFDFNGDGLDDLVLLTYAGYMISTYTLVSTGTSFSPSLISSQSLYTYQPIQFLNFNDDACTDFVSQTTLYISTCNGASAQSFPLSGTPLVAMDWDGDGRTDLLVANGSTIGVYLSTATGVSPLQTTAIPDCETCTYIAMNATGSGFDDLGAWTTSTGYGGLVYYLHNGVPDLVTNITDGYGNFFNPTYTSMAQGSYSPVRNAMYPDAPTYPYQYFMGPLYVVNQVTLSDPTNPPSGTYQQTYYYYDAWLNLEGRGFMGFAQYQRYDSRNKLWETYGPDTKFPFTGMMDFDLISWDQAGHQQVRYAFNNRVATTLDGTTNNERYFAYFNNMTVQTNEVGGPENGQLVTTASTSYGYDNYGNATSITTTVSDNDGGSPYVNQTWSTTTTNTPDVDTAHWCLRLLTESQVAYSSSVDNPAVTRTKQFLPDTANCRYSQVITEPSSSQYKVTEVLGYADGFGNITSDTVTGVGMTARQTLTDWGTTGQFPMTVTDPSGSATGTTHLDYDFRFGLLSKRTDPNGLVTSWQYDGLGHKTLENRPDGTSTLWSWPNSVSCAPPFNGCGLLRNVVLRYDRDTSGNNITFSDVELDPLDRPYEIEYLNVSGQYSDVDINYDPMGRVASRSEPFIWGSTRYFETYTYDVLNRIVQSERPINASNSSPEYTTYQYSGRTTTITDANSHAKVLVRDVNGGLRQTKDATGYAITLGYDAAGSHTSTIDSLGNTLWQAANSSCPSGSGYVYGIQAFLLGSTDADLGAWCYTHDALGELTAWTDAKGQSFSARYDVLSRMTDRYEPDLYSHWVWGTSASSHEIGQLHSVCTGTGSNPTSCSSAGYAENETYDGFGRLYQRGIQIPSDGTYTYTWLYNAATGLLDTLTYPTNPYGTPLKLKYGYAHGHLLSITDASDTPNVAFWTANAVDAAGHFTQETLGNQVVVKHGFDAVTGLVSSITAGLNGGTGLQNNSYLFDYVGNLTQRQDINANTTENVYPDALNRLDHTVGDSNTQMTYDSMGRVASWELYGATANVENYTTAQSGCSYYAWTQPHAVRQNTQGQWVSSMCYDANGNRTGTSVNGSVASTTSWTSYNQPNLMIGGSGNNSSSQFFYDQDHQRWEQVASYSGSPETTEYIGGLLERMQNSTGIQYRHYIPAGNSFIVYTESSTSQTPVTRYVTKDHLGSPAVITDQTGNSVVSEKYSATGVNETSAPATAAAITRHEYTGQEGLDNVYAVNMNGRVYGGAASVFLSPDPTIPDPTDTRSYNRYAYVNFNPLTDTDPTGFDDCPGGASCAFPIELPPINDQVTVTAPRWRPDPLVPVPISMEEFGVAGLLSNLQLAGLLPPDTSKTNRSPQKPLPPCNSTTLLPQGGGLQVGGSVEAGLPGVAGVAATGSAGGGAFYKPGSGFSGGAFAGGGATAYAGNSNVGAPTQGSAPEVLLASGGGGISFFVTNAQSVQQLSGPFTTYSLNVGFGPAQFSAQLALGGNIWDFSLSPGPAGRTYGVSLSRITTNTVTNRGNC